MKATVKDGVLTLTIDLRKTEGESKSGRSLIICTTHGRMEVPGSEKYTNEGTPAVLNLTCYIPKRGQSMRALKLA